MAQIAPEIFKAYDIRGIVGKTLTNEAAYFIGKAIATRAAEKGITCIALGRDGRLSGPELMEHIQCGFTDSGINVLNIGMVATPMLYFAAINECGGSGVMIFVAKEIELKDKFANMGAQMVKEVASKTSDITGDGTTDRKSVV